MRLSCATRVLGAAGVALLVGAFTAAPAGATARGRAPAGLTPIVECSLARGARTRTLFGYENTGPAVTISVGPNNSFSPGPPGRSQPTTFQRGTHINVFWVEGTGHVTWTLGNGRVESPGPSCKATPANSSLAGWGAIGAVVVVTAVLGTLLFWRTRRLRTVMP
jgi:hypothetical protein